jgi:hypothetical protein
LILTTFMFASNELLLHVQLREHVDMVLSNLSCVDGW